MKLLFTIFILFPLVLSAQLSISNTTWSEIAVTPHAVTRVGVFGQNVNGSSVQVHVTITDNNGVALLDVISAPVSVSNGMNMIAPNSFTQVRYAQNSSGDYIKTQNALPLGTYNFCLELLSNSIEVLDRYCESLVSTRDEFLNLVYPANGDSIYTTNPNLSWSHSGNFGDFSSRYYRIIVAECEKGQSNAEAINLNQPTWISNALNAHSITYPLNAPKLYEGHSYVWQVQMLYNGVVTQTSEVWRFIIAQKPIFRDLEYIMLTRNSSVGMIEAFNYVNVRFDEASNNNQIKVTATHMGSDMKPMELPFELKVEPGVGGNVIYLMKVDVSSLPIESKPYKLAIRSGQSIDYGLNFLKK